MRAARLLATQLNALNFHLHEVAASLERDEWLRRGAGVHCASRRLACVGRREHRVLRARLGASRRDQAPRGGGSYIGMFEPEVDAQARSWLDSHPADAYVIAYDVHRCCGGGKLCEVRVRELSRRDAIDGHISAALADGTRFLIDRPAPARLPPRFGLPVPRPGPLEHP